jgi:hypothetical protein
MLPECRRPNKAHQCVPKSAFHCMEGTVYYEYVPEGQQWINITVLKFWSDWGSPFIERGQRNGTLARAVQNDKGPAHKAHAVQVFFLFWQIMSRLWFRKILFPDMAQRTQWSTRWLFRKTHFKNVSNNGRNAGTNVWVQETILKGINYLLL